MKTYSSSVMQSDRYTDYADLISFNPQLSADIKQQIQQLSPIENFLIELKSEPTKSMPYWSPL